MSTKRLPVLPLLLALVGCQGASGPPAPVARATPAAAADGLQPLSSRDRPATDAIAAPSAAPSLPPGHPPIGSLDPHGNAATGAQTRSAGSITGTVTLAPRLAVGPSDVLYLIAKKGASTLAVRRVANPTFPLSFEISGADAMMTGVSFEGPLDLVARVSRSGDAIPAKGDLEGVVRNVKVPAQGVAVRIDSVRE